MGTPVGGSFSGGPLSRRSPGATSEVKAPPSLRALRCRLVGIVPSKEAAVLEVVAADEEWHDALSGVGPPEGLPGSPKAPAEPLRSSADTSRKSKSFKETHATESFPCSTATPPRDSPCLGDVFAFQQAERALRLQQQTSRDRILQEELLVQQEMLLRKMNPNAVAQQLVALERLLLQHPQLYAYHQQLYSYSHVPQRDAIGAWVLLPLKELLTYKRIRKGKKILRAHSLQVQLPLLLLMLSLLHMQQPLLLQADPSFAPKAVAIATVLAAAAAGRVC